MIKRFLLNKQTYIYITVLHIACFNPLKLQAVDDKTKPRPNIILIVSDDQGFDLGCYGKSQFLTPNLDKMATEGVKATQFYVTASVCTPSRSGLITGRYPQRNGTYEMIRNDMVNFGHRYSPAEYAVSPEMTLGLDTREMTFGNILQSSGYQTAVIGKWDMGQAKRFLPTQRGFHYFYGHGNNGIDYFTHERYGVHSMFRNNQRTTADQGQYATHIFRREALQFIRDNKTRPFFLYLPFNAPHSASNLQKDSSQVPAEYLKKYYPGHDHANPATKYAGMITAMDEAIGDIFQLIRELQLDQNTLVIFMADNGRNGAIIDGIKLRGGKSSGFEGGLRVPMIAWWPGKIPPGRTTTAFLSSLEILPTLASAAGAKIPGGLHLDGFDMLDVLMGKAPTKRNEMFWDWPSAYQAARVGQYKWISWNERDRRGLEPASEALYDLANDPSESVNLKETRPEIYRELKQKFHDWQIEMQMAEPRGPFRDY